MFLKKIVLPFGTSALRSKAHVSVRCSSSASHSLRFHHRNHPVNGQVTAINKLKLQPTHMLQTCNSSTLSSLARIPVCSADYSSHNNTSQCRSFTEDRKTTALTLIKDLKHLKSSPVPALVLGVAGVIPFAAAPAYIMASGTFVSSIAFSQVAYGACILSFLGGVRWGLTVSPDESIRPDWFNLGYSVTPSLVAWVGLMLPTSASILVLISGLLGACYMDVTMWGYPPWFKALRFLLTFLAVLSLWTTLMCRILMGSDKKKESKAVKETEPKEKSSWLPWKSSKPQVTAAPTAKVESDIPAIAEETVVVSAPVEQLPEVPTESETCEDTKYGDKGIVSEK